MQLKDLFGDEAYKWQDRNYRHKWQSTFFFAALNHAYSETDKASRNKHLRDLFSSFTEPNKQAFVKWLLEAHKTSGPQHQQRLMQGMLARARSENPSNN